MISREQKLDEALEDSFPASDPLPVGDDEYKPAKVKDRNRKDGRDDDKRENGLHNK